ncbi:MAG: DnaJ C-terminal domain-containing protein [Patescibacteria group bacterium]
MKDFYKILGVKKDATEDDIKKAYRRLAHQFHPDKPGGNESKFKEVSEAYQTLSNKEKRAMYDRFGRVDGAPGGSPFGAGGWPGFGDFNVEFGFGGEGGDFNDVFDAFFEGLGLRRRKTYQRGGDVEIVQEITLEEAFNGVKKTVKYNTLVNCKHCEGIGYDKKSGVIVCSACAGQGEIRESRRTFFGAFSQVKVCPDCLGSGEKPNKICVYCSGSGRETGSHQVEIFIKPGIDDRQVITVKGAGEAGGRNSQPGDLYLVVKVKPHPAFERRGPDLLIKQSISVAETFLGKKIKINTLAGRFIEIEMPSGFNFKEKLRIAGLGMPKLEGGHGDLYVDFELRYPKKLSAKAQKLLEELDKEL